MLSVIVQITIAILLISAVVLGEILLSKKSNKWLGLIIPFVGFLISIIIIIGYINWEPSAMKFADYYGSTLIHSFEISGNMLPPSTKIFNSFLFFLLLNIPTIIYLSIYVGFRKKMVSNLAISKMKLEDL